MVDLSSPLSLRVQDVAVNSRSNPSAICLHLRRSKTDPTGEGVFIFLGHSGTNVCLVSALLAYLAVHPSRGQHLFVWEDGKPLSRSELGHLLKKALEAAGLETSRYSGHSLHIGAAAGVPNHLIKVLGRWRSQAFQLYVHTPPDTLLSVASLIGGAINNWTTAVYSLFCPHIHL